MTASSKRSLLDVMLSAPRAGHPHLAPFNSHALVRQHQSAMRNLQGLVAYQAFLADARAAKAKRKRVEKTFERQVQRQSREALADATLLISSAMSATAQVNQTDFWQTLLRETSAGLDNTGPATAQDLWHDLRGRPDVISALADLGFTDKMVKIIDEAISTTHATIRGAAGNVEFAVRMPGRPDEFRTVLSGKRRRPRSVLDLIASPSFDQLQTSFLQGAPAIPAFGGGSQCVPGDVVACAAFASRQFLIDHVRKLEDTGLATYAGGDPGTLFVVFMIGMALYLAGLGIADLCRPDAEVIQPEPVCVAGGILTMLGIVAMLVGAAGFAGAVLVGAGVTSGIVLGASAGALGFGLVHFLVVTANVAGALDALGLGSGFTIEPTAPA